MSSIIKHPAVQEQKRQLRVLFVEDSEPDALLLLRALQRGGFNCVSQRVETREGMEAALAAQEWDLILADHSMPQFNAPEALSLLKKRELDVPFIIVSGHIEEETAVAAMHAGAHDYVMKDCLARLVPAVERELREAETRRVERIHQEELRQAREELESRVEERTADLKAAHDKLRKLLDERHRLENELLEIAENERRRIGFDLHDDLGQRLTGALLMVKGLQHKLASQSHPSSADAERVAELIEEIMHRTHDLAHQFSSLDVQGEDLCADLRGLAESARKMFNTPCVFSASGKVPLLPEHAMLQLHKIAQEAVSNAIKHGKASQVRISVGCDSDSLVLSIKNDGRPFTVPENSRKRMGLRIMKYRANTIGANLEIKPGPQGGAVVTCCLPIHAHMTNGGPATAGQKPRRGEAEPALLPVKGI